MKFFWQLELLRYEIRVTGIFLFALPFLFTACMAALAKLLQIGHVNQAFINYVLIAGLEACLPLIIGINEGHVYASRRRTRPGRPSGS